MNTKLSRKMSVLSALTVALVTAVLIVPFWDFLRTLPLVPVTAGQWEFSIPRWTDIFFLPLFAAVIAVMYGRIEDRGEMTFWVAVGTYAGGLIQYLLHTAQYPWLYSGVGGGFGGWFTFLSMFVIALVFATSWRYDEYTYHGKYYTHFYIPQAFGFSAGIWLTAGVWYGFAAPVSVAATAVVLMIVAVSKVVCTVTGVILTIAFSVGLVGVLVVPAAMTLTLPLVAAVKEICRQ